MNLAIIGTGNVGGNLGVLFAQAGLRVTFGQREGSDLSELLTRAGDNASALPIVEAVTGADVVFLAVPATAATEIASNLPTLDGKILVDCTNPVRWDAGPVWNPPEAGSVAAALAEIAPGAKVVKGFNTFGAEFHKNPQVTTEGISLFLAGDNDAKTVVGDIATAAGFSVVDAGPLRNAAVLENVAILWIHLATVGGRGRNFALQLLERQLQG